MKINKLSLGYLVVILALAGVGCGQPNNIDDTNLPEENAQRLQSSTNEVATSTNHTTTTPSTTTTPAKTTKKTAATTLTTGNKYTDIMKQYQSSGYRFQFIGCQATPGSMTLRTGVKYMLDNRDSKTHKIKVDSTTYTLKAYSYVIANAPSSAGLHYLTCDGGGSARINVEK